jgi:hypothetical protein
LLIASARRSFARDVRDMPLTIGAAHGGECDRCHAIANEQRVRVPAFSAPRNLLWLGECASSSHETLTAMTAG